MFLWLRVVVEKKFKELPGSGVVKTCVDGYDPGVVFWLFVKPDIYQGSQTNTHPNNSQRFFSVPF
jgi:hypothetical protein